MRGGYLLSINFIRREGMSALGHKQTFRSAIGMSALPPKADMCGAAGDVRMGQ